MPVGMAAYRRDLWAFYRAAKLVIDRRRRPIAC
jgi:hypothetical protein